MVSTSIDQIDRAPSPGFIGQATAIEQSRAIAEVQAMVIVAQQCPRDLSRVVDRMREACRQMPLAERAFYRYPRGKETITGPSVHLARELARCFGNVGYGVNELRRDDKAGISEMQAYAWDLEANTRSAQIFIVPHIRDTKTGPKQLTDLRDVYENNANNGARRLREAIYSILPTWFVSEAEDRCRATLRDGGGKSLPQRITDAISLFEGIGVSVDRLEAKVGRKTAQWNEHDIVQLGITYKSIQRGEITADAEFGSTRVTAAEIIGQKLAEPELDKPARVISESQVTSLQILAQQKGFRDRGERLSWASQVVEGNLESFKDLTVTEAAAVRAALNELSDVAS